MKITINVRSKKKNPKEARIEAVNVLEVISMALIRKFKDFDEIDGIPCKNGVKQIWKKNER